MKQLLFSPSFSLRRSILSPHYLGRPTLCATRRSSLGPDVRSLARSLASFPRSVAREKAYRGYIAWASAWRRDHALICTVISGTRGESNLFHAAQGQWCDLTTPRSPRRSSDNTLAAIGHTAKRFEDPCALVNKRLKVKRGVMPRFRTRGRLADARKFPSGLAEREETNDPIKRKGK